MMHPGRRIAERRIQLGMSQEELGDRVGTSQKQISRYENGHNDPTSDVLIKFAHALDTTADWLLGLTNASDRPLRGEGDLNDDERELIEIFRQKSADKRRQMKNVARAL
jgi:transcriptional regulator with XRE-family HTH domain